MYMKQRQVPFALDMPVLVQLPMMIMMMWIRVPLAKEMYTHLLGSLSVRLLAPTCHHMCTGVVFSMHSMVCVK